LVCRNFAVTGYFKPIIKVIPKVLVYVVQAEVVLLSQVPMTKDMNCLKTIPISKFKEGKIDPLITYFTF
jgi:hypothetical protein